MAKYNHDESLTENAERGVDITEPAVRYFEVRKEVLTGETRQYNVCADGSHAGTSESDGEAREITTGFNVWEYEEDGTTIGVEFYEVQTNMGDFTNNEDEVLEKIKQDHPAGEWQNHEW